MTTWQMWLLLAAMLYVGVLTSVGCFMMQFTLSALVCGGLALGEVDLETQLQCFLLLSLVFILASRRKMWPTRHRWIAPFFCVNSGFSFSRQESGRRRRIMPGQYRSSGGLCMASENVKEFTEDNFASEVLQNPGLVLVDFWAEWCGPCQRLAPIIDEIADEYAGKITVGKVNVSEAQRLAGQYGIMSIPTVVLFKQGKPVDRLVGLQSKEVITGKIDEFLG